MEKDCTNCSRGAWIFLVAIFRMAGLVVHGRPLALLNYGCDLEHGSNNEDDFQLYNH